MDEVSRRWRRVGNGRGEMDSPSTPAQEAQPSCHPLTGPQLPQPQPNPTPGPQAQGLLSSWSLLESEF